jgi:DNA-binding transcriptional ArsR family regulator
MGLTKTYHFDKTQNELAEFAKAFAHPARIAIIQYLLQNKTCIVGTLVDVLPLSQSTISQHLKELKRIGIIKGEIEGPSVCYCIDAEIWTLVRQRMIELFDLMDSENCC